MKHWRTCRTVGKISLEGTAVSERSLLDAASHNPGHDIAANPVVRVYEGGTLATLKRVPSFSLECVVLVRGCVAFRAPLE